MRVGIAGAGLIGRLIAWQWARRGGDVTLYEQDSAGADSSAAWVAAAMLAPWSEAAAGEPAVLEPALRSLALWPSLLEQLRADAGTAPALQGGGTLVLAHGHDDALLTEFETRLARLDAPAKVQQHDTETLRKLEPQLHRSFTRALRLCDETGFDNRALLTALGIALAQRVCWRRGVTVSGVAPQWIRSDDGDAGFDLVIDCRGFGARGQLPGLRGVRGEILRVKAPEVSLTHTLRLMHPRYQLYISPRPDHVYVVGATQIESESEAPVTVRSSLELLSALYSVSSGFAEAHILESHARCRPAFADNMPRVDISAGLISVNGLFRHGFLLAPVILEQALAAIGAAGGIESQAVAAR